MGYLAGRTGAGAGFKVNLEIFFREMCLVGAAWHFGYQGTVGINKGLARGAIPVSAVPHAFIYRTIGIPYPSASYANARSCGQPLDRLALRTDSLSGQLIAGLVMIPLEGQVGLLDILLRPVTQRVAEPRDLGLQRR